MKISAIAIALIGAALGTFPSSSATAAQLFAAPALPASSTTLPPRDECASDPSFAAFRTELMDILVRRDADRLIPIIAEDIEWSFGGDAGRARFVESWGLADPANSPLWTELAGALMLGCARQGGAMVAPYLYNHMPEGLDLFDSGVARAGATLYSAPDVVSEGVPLAWSILNSAEFVPGGWIRVDLADGRSGYLQEADFLSPADYRAFFEKRGGAWRLTVFIAGD